MNPIPIYIWKERSGYVYRGVTSFGLTSKPRFYTQYDFWLAFLFFLNKTIENKQRITLDVRHCLMSHLSFFWLFGFHSILSTLDWNAPTQQNHVLFEFSCSSEDLILIHVILRDGTGPAYSHSECTSALKCLLSPRTQTVRASG